MKEARPDQIWTIPNILTMIRLALIPLYWVLMVQGKTYQALAVYVIASLTDLADGYIARKYHQITNFGKLMDPVADKVMVLSVMLSMVLPLGGRPPVLPWAPFIILLCKEALMILGGAVLLKKGVVVYAKKIGKIAQLVMVLSLIASFFHETFTKWGFPLHLILLWTAVALTLCALVFYARDSWNQYQAKKAAS